MSVIGEAVVVVRPESSGFVSSLENQLKSIGGAGLAIGVGVATAAIVGGLVAIGKQFGAARVQITRETGLTGAAVDDAFKSVKTVLATVPSSIGDTTTAIDELIRRGTPLGATLNKLAEQELELAKITKSDLGANVQDTTALFAKFNVPLAQQPAALDAIFKGYQQSGVALSDFIGTLKAGATSLGQFGFTISDSVALIASLDKAGVNATAAMAGLKKGFAEIVKEGGNPKQALGDLVKEFTDGTPRAVALADAIKLFGARSGTELAVAIQQGKFQTADLLKIITDGRGGILDTAAATRTFGENLDILRNRAEVALQPLASATWAAIKGEITDLTPPAEAVAVAFAHLFVSAAPIGELFGVAIFGALKAVGPLLDSFAAGVDTVASLLDKVPGPVLAVAAAILVTVAAIGQIQTAGGVGAVASAIGDLNPVTAGLIITAAVLTALGAVVKIFGGQESAAVAEAKKLDTAIFDTANSATIFATNVTSASQGLLEFLQKQEQAGKLGTLDKALSGTNITLGQLASAAGSSGAAWDKFKQSAVSVATQGFNPLQKSLLGVSSDLLFTKGQQDGLSTAQIFAVKNAQQLTSALQDQRDALAKTTDQTLDAERTSGQLTQSQFDAAKAIETGTGAYSGLDAAVTFANAALGENAAKLAQQQIAALDMSGAMNTLKSEIIDGTIGTNDATDAAARFGVGLDAAKQIISDTQAALKSFVSDGLKGLPNSEDAVTNWEKGIETAFKGVADAAGKSPEEMRKAQADLVKAMDPQQVVAQIQKETVQIAVFANNIKTLLGRDLPDAVKTLLANPDKQAAAAYAQALVDNVGLAKQFNTAQHTLSTRTSDLETFLKGPAAHQLLVGGQAAGASLGDGLVSGLTQQEARVEAQATHLATLAVNATRREFQSHSPSRVGIDIGRSFVQGITIGLSDTVALATAARLTGRVAIDGAAGASSSSALGFPTRAGSRTGSASSGDLSLDLTVVLQDGTTVKVPGVKVPLPRPDDLNRRVAASVAAL